MTQHHFDYFAPGLWRFAPLFYAFFASIGLGFAGIIGWGLHRSDLLKNGCNSPEIVPSISATIGDFKQERIWWRWIFPFAIFSQFAIMLGMHRLYQSRVCNNSNDPTTTATSIITKAKNIFCGKTFNLGHLHALFCGIRLSAAFGWTMIASFESLLVHEASFGFYAVFGIIQHIIAYLLARRHQQIVMNNSKNQHQQQNDPSSSAYLRSALSRASMVKLFGVIAQLIMILLLAKFFIVDHAQYCLPYAYSKACFCEWIWSYLDIAVDSSYYYDFLIVDMTSPDPHHASSADTALQMLQRESSSTLAFSSSRNKNTHDDDTTSTNTNSDSNNNNTTRMDDDTPQQQQRQHPRSAETALSSVAPYFWIPSYIQKNGVPRILLWVSDIFFGYMVCASSVAVFQAVYFVPMVAMNFTNEAILVLGPLLVAFILRSTLVSSSLFLSLGSIPGVSMAKTCFRPTIGLWLAYAFASLSFLHVLIEENSGTKILVACFGPGALVLAFRIRTTIHNMRHVAADKIVASNKSTSITNKNNNNAAASAAPSLFAVRDELRDETSRLAFSVPLGLLFSLIIRFYFVSVDPFYTYVHCGPIATCLCLLIFIPCLALQERFMAIHVAIAEFRQQTDFATAYFNKTVELYVAPFNQNPKTYILRISHRISPFVNYALVGCAFGSFLMLGMQYCTSANVIQRLIAVDPLSGQTSLLFIFTFACGIAASSFYSKPGLLFQTASARTYQQQQQQKQQSSASSITFSSALLTSPVAVITHRQLIQLLCFVVGPLILFFGTTQSNIMTPSPSNQLEKWSTTEFFGSPNFAFFGGLLLIFGLAAVAPATAAAFWGLPISQGASNDGNLYEETFSDAELSVGFMRTESICFLTYVLFIFVGVYIVCFPFVPGGFFFRDHYEYFLFPCCFLIFATQRMLFPPTEINNNNSSLMSGSRKQHDDDNNNNTTDDNHSDRNDTKINVGNNHRDESNNNNATALALDGSPHKAVAPCQPETSRVSIVLRLFLIIALFAFLWRIIQQPPSNSRDPFAQQTKWILDTPEQEFYPPLNAEPQSQQRYLEMSAEAYRRKNSVSTGRFLQSDAIPPHQSSDLVDDSSKQHANNKKPTDPASIEKDNLKNAYSKHHHDYHQSPHHLMSAHITAAIWTLHFGLDNDGSDSLDRIVDHIRVAQASIVGLLESDGQRVQTANRDILEYVAYHTNLPYTDFGPTTTESTFGCALLSRFPILSVKRIVAPSPMGELACLIDAVVEIPHDHPMRPASRNKNVRELRVLVGHNGNTDHVQDLVLQTDLIGKIAADASAKKQPIIFLGYVTSQPSLVGHNYYRMIQSDGEDVDRILQRSSKRLFDHGFDFKTVGKGIPRPQIPFPSSSSSERNRFRDVTRDLMLWTGPVLSFESQEGDVKLPWTDPRVRASSSSTNSNNNNPRTYWEALLMPGAEYAFLNWTLEVLPLRDENCVKMMIMNPDWETKTKNLDLIRTGLDVAAKGLWEDILVDGLTNANPMNATELQSHMAHQVACTETSLMTDSEANIKNSLYRKFLDMHWLKDAGAEHRYVKTRFFSVLSEKPKVRPEHPRFNFEDRYCQQIYYKDVMILDWYRDPIGKISDTELQVFTFGV